MRPCSGHCLQLIAPTQVRCRFGENFLAFSVNVRKPPMNREHLRKGIQTSSMLTGEV